MFSVSRCVVFSSQVAYWNWMLIWFLPDFISFLNLIKENVVVADVWLVTTSAVGSLHLGRYYPHVMAASLHLSLVSHCHHHPSSFICLFLFINLSFVQRLTMCLLLAMIENSSRVGSFLMDFSAYPKLTGKDVWSSGTKASERVPGNQSITSMGKYVPHPWQSSSENNPSELLLPVPPAGGTSFSGPGNPSGGCINGVADSSCALSLLSNQTWGSRNRTTAVEVNALLNAEGALVAQTATPHAATNHFPTMSWGFKGNEVPASSSLDLTSDLGLNHQVSQALTSSFSGDVQFPHQGRRPYMELGHSGAFDSTQHLHWSLWSVCTSTLLIPVKSLLF